MSCNEEMVEFWNGQLGLQWVHHQELLDAQLAEFGRRSRALLGPLAGVRVLDVGCGCGASALELARAVGSRGRVVGIDISAPMLSRARARARALGLSATVSFMEADAQIAELGAGVFDAVYSRFGVMFFARPIAAFRNLSRTLKAGGLIAFVCWRRAERNPWFTETAEAASAHLTLPEELPPRAPGPFGLAERSWIEEVLSRAGFAELEIQSSDVPMDLSAKLEDLVELQLSIGPVGRALRETAVSLKTRGQVERAVREALGTFLTPRGYVAPASVWLVQARCPR
ncbi:MAG: class I SAM-dependent methyltransferase [Actinomycetia bacterium]|nr:class I SAM-dependent methyltransferase [Actinomycetes bacterium]